MNERTGSELRKVPFSRSQRLWGQSDTKSHLLFHAASFTWSRGKCCVSSPQAHTLQEHGSSQQLFYYVFLNDFLLHKENISILHMKKIFDFYLSFFLYLCFGARDKQYSRGDFLWIPAVGDEKTLLMITKAVRFTLIIQTYYSETCQ